MAKSLQSFLCEVAAMGGTTPGYDLLALADCFNPCVCVVDGGSRLTACKGCEVAKGSAVISLYSKHVSMTVNESFLCRRLERNEEQLTLGWLSVFLRATQMKSPGEKSYNSEDVTNDNPAVDAGGCSVDLPPSWLL